jgi:hypothetical protein
MASRLASGPASAEVLVSQASKLSSRSANGVEDHPLPAPPAGGWTPGQWERWFAATAWAQLLRG